jgi:TusA-related sulfurtransferase
MAHRELPHSESLEILLTKYALGIAAASLTAGIVCVVTATQGNLDNTISYCDAVSNPCTPEVVAADRQLPKTAKLKEEIPGQGLLKLLAAVFGTGLCTLAAVAFSAELKQAERDDQLLAESDYVATQERAIDASTRLQAHQIVQDANLAVHKKIVQQAAAEHLLEELPELVEHLIDVSARQDAEAQESAEAEQKEVEEERELAKLEAIASDEEANAPKPDPREWTIKTLPRQYRWLDNFLADTGLIWGSKGSGKSWFTRLIAYYKKQEGHHVVVLDAHSKASEWVGVESYHTHEDIKAYMERYLKEVEARQSDFRNSPLSEDEWKRKVIKDGHVLSVVCEECTEYKALFGKEFEETLQTFYLLSMTAVRKYQMTVTFVCHNNTQEIFGIRGLGNLIDKMLQVELLATRDPVTKQPTASGTARLKMAETNDIDDVTVPHISTKITNFEIATERESEQKPESSDASNLEKFPTSSDLQAMYDSLALPGLTPLQEDILRFLKEKGKQTIRQLQQNGYPSIKKAKASEIKSALDGLLIGEMVSVDGSFYSAL